MLILAILAGCTAREADVVHVVDDGAGMSQQIDAYVAAGRTPEAFARLAGGLDRRQLRSDAARAAEAEVRLLALALPHADTARSYPIGEQASRLALTVWPVLLDHSLATGTTNPALAPHASEDAASYLARLCETVLVAQCGDVVPEARAVAVRAVAMHRADARMRIALATWSDPEWMAIGWKWESLAHDGEASLNTIVGRDAWPAAGAGSREPATNEAVDSELVVDTDGAIAFADGQVSPRSRIDILHDVVAANGGTVVLRVSHGLPLAHLAAAVADARRAGATTIALAARTQAYPWARRIYAVDASRMRSSISTVQRYVEQLDTSASTTASR